jgi:hypothetical protein
MAWNLTGLSRRRFLQPAPRKPIRKAFRPALERLEDRLAPANVSVYSFHNDPAITGQNLQETVLTPANVNPTTFGKLASVAVDGYTYAQPLYVANLMVNGTPHNVAFVGTEHDSLYAFDIVNDPSATTGVRINLLWQRSFITGGPGGPTTPGITSVPNSEVGTGDIVPEIGITGAPAIDPATNVLYVVAKTKEVRGDGNHYVQKLYALDITSPTGADKTAPYTIGDSKGDGFNNQTTAIVVAGAGADASSGANPMIAFNAFRENQRPSLQLLNGRVYVGWASHGDNGPYHGWVVGFNETTLLPEKIFNTAPNSRAAGIWQSEGAISTDGRYLFFAVGNAFQTNGPISGAIITNPGSGYTSAPTVTITGGGGSGATATATISSGMVTGITITNGGSNYAPYTGAPAVPTSITFSGGGATTPAVAYPISNGWGFNPLTGNYSESVIKIDTMAAGTIMPVADYFTPFNWTELDRTDADLGSGGVMLLPESVGSAAHPHLMVETGKDGHIYLLDRDGDINNPLIGSRMGRFTVGSNSIVQDLVAGPGGVWGNPAFYMESPTSGLIVYHGSGTDTREFRITGGQIVPVSPGVFITYRSNQGFGFPGAQPIISGNGTDATTYVDWELQVDNYGSQGLANLHAYAARPAGMSGTLTELYNSNMAGVRDQLTSSVKFTSATESNGWVFVAQGGLPAGGLPASGSFNVFGLFPTHAAAPVAPTNLAGMGVSPTAIQITWTSPSPNTATGIKIFRSAGDDMHFAQVSTANAGATSFTDVNLTQGQVYFYKIAATNQAGDSAQTSEIQASPLLSPPVLSPDNVASNKVTLVWTRPPAANDHYNVERSTSAAFTTFTTVATGLPGSQLSYTDADPMLVSQPGQYYYRVRAFTSPAGTLSAVSNVVGVKVGPLSGVINYPAPTGFPLPPATPIDLQANGSAQFAETTARLTNAVNQRGSVFSTNQENILNWTTSFQVRLHEGTQPSYANGFAFVIQAISPGALGLGAAGLGYQGIPNSVAIKFETTTGAAENGTGGSTGLFYGGSLPTVASKPGEVNVMLDGEVVNLDSQSNKTILLSYAYNPVNPALSILHEEIDDPDHPMTPFTHDYAVDLPSLLGLPGNGNTIGYVGFTGSTGTGGFWELQDILNWVFTPTGPAAPHNLGATAGSNFVDLSWKATSADEAGYYVERFTNLTTGFVRIATLDAGVTTYHDNNNGMGLTNPTQYYYRVQAFNHSGPAGAERDSGYSNVATGSAVNVNFSSFPNSTGFAFQNTGVTPAVNVFPGTPAVLRLTDGRNSEATSAWYTTPVGNGAFTTTFTLKDVPNSGAADSLSFVIQNDPRGTTALGGNGGSGGYSGIVNSIAVKFDLYTQGSHNSSTGLYLNGQAPSTAGPQFIMGPTPIDLRTGDPIQVTLTYDGNNTLLETVQDLTTGAVFFHSYTLTMALAQILGGSTAYVGFTGGTGGENATQDILSWTGQFSSPQAVPTYLQLNAPSGATAGTSFQVTVTALDPGNHRIAYTGTVHFTSSDVPAMLPSNYTFTPADNGRHVFTVTLKTAGSQTVAVTDTVNSSLTATANVAVSPGALSTFLVTDFPSPTTAGDFGAVIVTAKDASGNTIPNYTGTVHLSSSDLHAQLPGNYTFRASENGSHAFVVALKTAGMQSITVNDTTTPSVSGTQSGIVVTPSSITGLTLSGLPSTAQSGVPVPFTVSATDAYGNAVPGYTGTVSFSSTDPGALPPPSYTFSLADNGTHTFSATFETSGARSLTVTDAGNGYSATGNLTVIPFALMVSGFPSSMTAGQSSTFTVRAVDANNNTDTGYTGIVHFTSSDLQANLPDDYSFTATDMGVHTFGAVLKTAGTQFITATDTATASITGTQGGIAVSPSEQLGSFRVSGFPNSVAGTLGAFTVAALDLYGNLISDYAGVVHFSSSDPQATAGNGLPLDYTFSAADMGMHSFTATLFTAGSQSITATDVASGAFGSQEEILISPAQAVTLQLTGDSTATAGDFYALTVTTLDAFGNPNAPYTGTIVFSSSDSVANKPPDYTFTVADNGSHFFMLVFNTPGTQSVTATDKSDGSITGTLDVTVF